ncbi:hypothetical protein ILYODFUR_008289 [Ilyodon furcidens]|uniref:Uncharacterized protein n=1 Tax=Ilyodon furcidens TaxID=33524 RepID=A0ABV0T7K2_9TELE
MNRTLAAKGDWRIKARTCSTGFPPRGGARSSVEKRKVFCLLETTSCYCSSEFSICSIVNRCKYYNASLHPKNAWRRSGSDPPTWRSRLPQARQTVYKVCPEPESPLDHGD